MSRWIVEKNGTGIEKSGTGIEKSGTGIEKSGSGIEKSGTGIEKSGSGIRASFLAFSIAAITFASQVSASEEVNPAGVMNIVVESNTVAVSWIIDGSVFSGVASLSGSFANLGLTEIGLAGFERSNLLIAGSGTGASKEIAGSGTGVEIAGSGTGVEIAGSGTGVEIAGSGTGVEIAGSGTGVEIAGSGTGSEGLGESRKSTILIAGSGTGSDAIIITLPDGTDMQMEISFGCNSANVAILDANFVEVVAFENVPVTGASGFCSGNNRSFSGFRGSNPPREIGERK